MAYTVQVRVPPHGNNPGYWKQLTPDDLSSDPGMTVAAYMQAKQQYKEVRMIEFEIMYAHVDPS